MKKLEEAEDFINLGVVVNDKGEVLMIRRKKRRLVKKEQFWNGLFPAGNNGLTKVEMSVLKGKY